MFMTHAAAYLIVLTHHHIVCFEQICSVFVGDIVLGIEWLLFGPCINVRFTSIFIFVQIIVIEIIKTKKKMRKW
jgi:hypothetical protein